jgi:hypothetical protein
MNGNAVRNVHGKSTKRFYHKCPESVHDGVSCPINPQGM